MVRFSRLFAAGMIVAGVSACESFDRADAQRNVAQAQVSEQQQLVDRARITVDAMRTDPAYGNSPDLLRRARALFIVPELTKGAFVVGAEGGTGVLMVKRGNTWSDPAFYYVGSGSLGLQIGVQQAEAVMFIMSDKALNAFMKDRFTLGGEAGLAVANIGANAEAQTSTNLGADVITWARAAGAFAGISLEGSVVQPRQEWNQAYYGSAALPEQIVRGSNRASANTLRSALPRG